MRGDNKPWELLLRKHIPEHARICNCGQAYEYPCGIGVVDGEDRNDIWTCPAGCSAAQIASKEHIAECIIMGGPDTHGENIEAFGRRD